VEAAFEEVVSFEDKIADCLLDAVVVFALDDVFVTGLTFVALVFL
jgi:hypothetical protein